ncbi:hypothetical protein CEXT_724851 [Caerostris extrusa]|uniref:Ycf15 n=1 Tax=Caerostris extrusa TaxID=172846 RepID=A0AAV4W575_CAEEX|nr:hypothetical protein CEXT_724851 [Caerostris extrusa]
MFSLTGFLLNLLNFDSCYTVLHIHAHKQRVIDMLDIPHEKEWMYSSTRFADTESKQSHGRPQESRNYHQTWRGRASSIISFAFVHLRSITYRDTHKQY